MSSTTRSYIYALLTVLFWSTVATAFKLALAHLDIYQLVLYACLTSVIVLVCAVTYQNRTSELLRSFRIHWRITLMAGLLNPVIYYLILFAAYDRLPAQVAQPINYTWAIVLTFLSIVILKQKMTIRDIVAAFVCYSGVIVIAGQGAWSIEEIPDGLGVALAILSTFVWASYWILNLRDPREPTIALCLNFMIALPISLAVCLTMSDPLDVSVQGLGGAVYVGVFEMGLSFLLWSSALKLAENTSRVSNLIFLSPFVSLVFINQVLGEPIYATTYVGLIVIVSGLVLQRLRFD